MRIIFCLMVFLFIGKNTMLAQQLSSFVEYGAALHTGDNTPLWQVSNQQGLTSLDNNTYIRGGISYKHQLGKWKFEEALDLVAAAGFSTTSFIVQQAYVDIRYKWFGFFAGSREQNSPLQAAEVSSSTSVTTKSEIQKTTAGTVAPSLVSAQKYHVIIASVGTEKDAEAMAKQLIEKGYPHAKAIVGDGKMRVSIESCGTETEAYQALNRVRQNETYKNAWVLKK